MEKSSFIRISAVLVIVILAMLVLDTKISVSGDASPITYAVNAAKGKLFLIGLIGVSMGFWSEGESKNENSPNAFDGLVKVVSTIVFLISMPAGIAGALAYLGAM
ncbi:MAG: hypothetical protein OQL08_02400 [Gammaproteobacteria bacterium]|nr:hypothetical protein [Gammaproteobacteria bacterium]